MQRVGSNRTACVQGQRSGLSLYTTNSGWVVSELLKKRMVMGGWWSKCLDSGCSKYLFFHPAFSIYLPCLWITFHSAISFCHAGFFNRLTVNFMFYFYQEYSHFPFRTESLLQATDSLKWSLSKLVNCYVTSPASISLTVIYKLNVRFVPL